ncbi:zinc ABC transporter substrate-binding protein [Neomegalonema sp.]|uniref:metal ABC transporter solute-binding protein, Zn/Mn family n=1 Tax=Neomegalonema sp. TaxID=2039713 RepID=UPI002617C91E|nr:zinc ABC transporter substrate-binding protein [Neomegalonema sp.]
MAAGLVLSGAAAAPAQEAPLQVVATTGMIADAARGVGGERAQVRALMGSGVDPHGYRATRSDVTALARADLVLWHGLNLEAQMRPLLEELGESGASFPVAEALPKEKLQPLAADGSDSEGHDPHVWMDVALWSGILPGVRDQMCALRPADCPVFAANAEAYAGRLAALEARAREAAATVPPERRVLVTAHDAFGYFGAAYGFEVEGVQGVSTESEAGLKRVGDLVEILVSRGIGAVFVESSVSDRNLRALVEGAAARGRKVAIGGELFSDAMGPAGSYEGTYPGMMDHNFATIVQALGGAAQGQIAAQEAARAERGTP